MESSSPGTTATVSAATAAFSTEKDLYRYHAAPPLLNYLALLTVSSSLPLLKLFQKSIRAAKNHTQKEGNRMCCWSPYYRFSLARYLSTCLIIHESNGTSFRQFDGKCHSRDSSMTHSNLSEAHVC